MESDIQKIRRHFENNGIKYHEVTVGFHTGIAKMGGYDIEGHINVNGRQYPLKDYSQLVSFIEFNHKGEMVSVSREYDNLCYELGIGNISEDSLGVVRLPIKLFKVGDYVTGQHGPSIVTKATTVTRKYSGIDCFIEQYLTVKPKSGDENNPSCDIRDAEWNYTFPITKEEYDAE